MLLRRNTYLAWLAGLSLIGCYASSMEAPAGGAADSAARAEAEPPGVDPLAPDFDPFSAYPELSAGAGDPHAHHGHGAPAPAEASPDAGAGAQP